MKSLGPVIRDGYSVEFLSILYSEGEVVYREGSQELRWSAEWGTDNSFLVRVPRSVSFSSEVTHTKTKVNLAQGRRESQTLTEERVREIKKRVSEALKSLDVEHKFLREGWTSFGDANEITESQS